MLSTETIIFIAATICAIFGWLINLVKNLASKRMDDLETFQECNFDRIEKLKDRVTELEHTTVKRVDLEFILGSWKEDIKESVDNSFERVHERIDEIYNKTSNCEKFQEVIKRDIPDSKLTKRPAK